MLLGDKDDNLPARQRRQDYLAYSKGAGPRPLLEVSIYPGAYHA